ncbi:MAG: MFS transporter [Puniceicoccales bacterium]|jgi:MFS family permease|nr:MFS transporter [Puniceicoccales bacterium]
MLVGCFFAALPGGGVGTFALGRMLMGAGSAFAFIGAMYVASAWFPRRRWAFLSGLTTALGMGGAILGQAPVALLLRHCGWRGSWLMAGAIGIAVAILLHCGLPPEPEGTAVDGRGESQRVLRHFFSSLSSVLRNSQTWLAGLVACSLFLPLIVFADFWGVHYIELLTGATTAQAATANGMLYLGWLVGSPLVGSLSDWVGRRKPFLVGSCLMGMLLLLAILGPSHLSLSTLGLLLFLLGILSSPQVICFTVSSEHNGREARGTAIAAVNTAVMFIGGIMQPVVGLLLDHCAGDGSSDFTLNQFRSAFLILPIAMAVGLLLSLALRESGEGARQQK